MPYFGFGFSRSGFRVIGLCVRGFAVQRFWLPVWGAGLPVCGFGFLGLRFRVSVYGFRVWGFGFGVSLFWIWGLGFSRVAGFAV